MKTLIDALPQHLIEANTIYQNTTLQPAENRIENLVITGLGGSGIGASIVAEMLRGQLQVPVTINKDYDIPAFAGKNTLVIACSYSGNTEETLSAVEAAHHRGCMVAALSSGGKLVDFAKKHNLNHFIVPGGNPPRSMLGYSLVLLFAYMEHYELAKTGVSEWTKSASELLRNEHDAANAEALKIAEVFKNKIAVVYACDGMGALATRVRQQLNENSKMVGWDGVIPEMNHNELVGWHFEHPEIAVLILRTAFEHPRNTMRAELNRDILLKKTPNVVEIHAKGKSPIESAFYLIHLTDLLSYHLSEMHAVDIMDIDVIDYLKGELAKR
ncbi:MAG: bifunctional phosphoglucose/phosphomannose isomerase [Cryomorphaceae bacterium]|nr:bifunctional phosphoglucose/phosphomannose isomerase [Cryomorphaceae bacterium]